MRFLEIRDRLTFIPALAVRLNPACEADRYLLARAGFGQSHHEQREHVVLIHLTSMRAQWDPFGWGDRTMTVAHEHIAPNFDTLKSGDVVDVEYLLGETQAPKQPERAAPPLGVVFEDGAEETEE